MSEFLKELDKESEKHHWEGDVIDLLATFSDFSSFKSAMLDAKKVCQFSQSHLLKS